MHTVKDTTSPPERGLSSAVAATASPGRLFHLLKISPPDSFLHLTARAPPIAVFVPQTANCLLRRSCHPARTVMGTRPITARTPPSTKCACTLPLNRVFPVHSHHTFTIAKQALQKTAGTTPFPGKRPGGQ